MLSDEYNTVMYL